MVQIKERSQWGPPLTNVKERLVRLGSSFIKVCMEIGKSKALLTFHLPSRLSMCSLEERTGY